MKLNRRDFLSHSLKMLGLMGMSSIISENFLRSIVNQAYGSVLEQPEILNSYKYLHITMSGAPPRWYFDLPLTPAGQTANNFMAGGFGNSYQISGNNVSVVHTAWKHNASGLYLPPVWNMSVSGHPFSDLLQYTGFIRGIDNEIDSHALSNSRQVAPIIGGYSLSGANADERKNPIASVNLNGGNAGAAFKSRKNLSSTVLAINSNPITTLLDPFKIKSTTAIHSGGTEQLVNQVINKIDEEARALRTSKSALKDAHENAKSLIMAGTQTLANQYPTLLAKYTAIVNEAVHPSKGSLPGIFDKPIPGSSTDVRHRFGTTTTFASISDLRDGINANTTVTNMAAQFAVVEILLTSGLTSTVTTNLPGVSRFQFTSSSTSGTITHDQHDYGSVVQTLINTLYFRAMLGCLHELVRVLNTQGLFDKTLIHIASEFNRAPKTSGAGADHGVNGSNATLISGMIQGPFVIGNIYVDSQRSNYAGTWGLAAPYQLDAEVRPIKVNDVARTVSSMLRMSDVVTNGFSLLNPVNTVRWAPKVKKADNV